MFLMLSLLDTDSQLKEVNDPWLQRFHSLVKLSAMSIIIQWGKKKVTIMIQSSPGIQRNAG